MYVNVNFWLFIVSFVLILFVAIHVCFLSPNLNLRSFNGLNDLKFFFHLKNRDKIYQNALFMFWCVMICLNFGHPKQTHWTQKLLLLIFDWLTKITKNKNYSLRITIYFSFFFFIKYIVLFIKMLIKNMYDICTLKFHIFTRA